MDNGAVTRSDHGTIEVHFGDNTSFEMQPLDAVKLAFLLLRYAGVPMSVDLMNRILGNFEEKTVN